MTINIYAVLKNEPASPCGFTMGGRPGPAKTLLTQLNSEWPLSLKCDEVKDLVKIKKVYGVNISAPNGELKDAAIPYGGEERILKISAPDDLKPAKLELLQQRLSRIAGVQSVTIGAPKFDAPAPV